MVTRLIFFGVLLIGFGTLQYFKPARAFTAGRSKRLFSSFIIVMLNNGLLLLLPIIPIKTAIYAEDKGLGLMNLISIPVVVELIVCLLIMDLIIYWQHRLFHTNNVLWRLHRMHHMEPLLEVVSGFRFHPFEIIVSNFIKVGVILVIGVSPFSILVFEVWLSSLAMFNHANILLPAGMERFLRNIVFTPLKHNVHHSIILKEMSSNFGFSVPWWDMLFGSYKTEGQRSLDEIVIGVPGGASDKELNFPGMLLAPFKK